MLTVARSLWPPHRHRPTPTAINAPATFPFPSRRQTASQNPAQTPSQATQKLHCPTLPTPNGVADPSPDAVPGNPEITLPHPPDAKRRRRSQPRRRPRQPRNYIAPPSRRQTASQNPAQTPSQATQKLHCPTLPTPNGVADPSPDAVPGNPEITLPHPPDAKRRRRTQPRVAPATLGTRTPKNARQRRARRNTQPRLNLKTLREAGTREQNIAAHPCHTARTSPLLCRRPPNTALTSLADGFQIGFASHLSASGGRRRSAGVTASTKSLRCQPARAV